MHVELSSPEVVEKGCPYYMHIEETQTRPLNSAIVPMCLVLWSIRAL